MDENFKQALKQLVVHEGGVSDDAHDSGGLTNLGVTHLVYDRYRRWKGLPLRPVTMITNAEVEEIYREFYWKPVQCDKLVPGVDNCVFDMAVNNGIFGAAKAAQRVAAALTGRSLAVDGHIGPISLDAIDDCDPRTFIDAFCDERLRVDRTFKNWPYFGAGWTNRINGNKRLRITGVREESKGMVLTTPVAAKPPLPVYTQAKQSNSFMNALLAVAKWFRLA